jgi:hypothetical protein
MHGRESVFGHGHFELRCGVARNFLTASFSDEFDAMEMKMTRFALPVHARGKQTLETGCDDRESSQIVSAEEIWLTHELHRKSLTDDRHLTVRILLHSFNEHFAYHLPQTEYFCDQKLIVDLACS